MCVVERGFFPWLREKRKGKKFECVLFCNLAFYAKSYIQLLLGSVWLCGGGEGFLVQFEAHIPSIHPNSIIVMRSRMIRIVMMMMMRRKGRCWSCKMMRTIVYLPVCAVSFKHKINFWLAVVLCAFSISKQFGNMLESLEFGLEK